jgi:hypothetical protein
VDRRDGRRGWRFARTELTRGFRTDDEVRLETRRGETLVLSIDSVATGEALLGALGLDARHRVLEVPIANIASRVPGGSTFAWIMIVLQSPGVVIFPFALITTLEAGTLSHSLPTLALTVVALLTLAASVSAVRQRSAAIGMDGIVFRRFLREHFYPYSAVTGVAHTTAGVLLTLSSGRSVHLRTRGFWARSAADEAALALFERIETARAAASGHDVRATLPRVERRARSAGEWRTPSRP